MPLYNLYNKKTGESKEKVFMNLSEYESYDETDDDGNRIYSGDELEYEEVGDVIFVMTLPAIAGPRAKIQQAQKKHGRGLADKTFGSNKWV
jgi:hypothetical protein